MNNICDYNFKYEILYNDLFYNIGIKCNFYGKYTIKLNKSITDDIINNIDNNIKNSLCYALSELSKKQTPYLEIINNIDEFYPYIINKINGIDSLIYLESINLASIVPTAEYVILLKEKLDNTCKICGAKLKDISLFCPNCGRRVKLI